MIVEERYFIGYQYVGADLKLKNSSILCMLEDIAGLHGILAGESIKTSPTTWLLSAYRVIVKKRPEYGDRVTLRTWSREIRNFFACREFEMIDASGEVIVTAISEWAHINRFEGKLEKCSQELADAYRHEPDYSNFDRALRVKRLKTPENFDNRTEFTVGRNWIDANHHMNNVYYLDLAEMALPENVSESLRADEFSIFYKKEIKCGETVECRSAETDDGYMVSVIDKDGTLRAQIMLYKEGTNG